jgi:hypothetical protein
MEAFERLHTAHLRLSATNNLVYPVSKYPRTPRQSQSTLPGESKVVRRHLCKYDADLDLVMPRVGGKQHHCRYCSSTSSNTKGVGYCADHQEVCQDPDGLHKGVTMYKYKKTSVSNAEGMYTLQRAQEAECCQGEEGTRGRGEETQ